MKRLLFIVLAAMLLVACGKDKVHENINEDMAQDTKQVLSIYGESIKEDRLFTEKESLTVEDYLTKYGARYNQGEGTSHELSEEESRLFILTRNWIEIYPEGVLYDSGIESFKNTKEIIETVINTGEI